MNPFRDGIVASPWETTGIDVNTIHNSVYQACLKGIEQVRDNHRSSSLLIHGAAGSGKTHLLRRLRGDLASVVPPSTDRQECLFVWVRLQTSPRMIWRTFRRTLVEDWFRPVRAGKTQFERILLHRLAQIRTAEGDLERWYEYIIDHDPNALKVLIEQIADSLHLDRNTAVAFEHIAFQRHMRDLRAWLAGDSLPETALTRMELSQDEGTDEEREEESRKIVLMLCRLAGDSLPILVSFDQVEALEMFPGDRDGLFSFGQVTSSLHDSTTNVFVISCVQSSFFNRLSDHSRQADYDRMTSDGALSLHPLSRKQAEELIRARLKNANITVPVEGSAALCWPLEEDELEERVRKGDLTPRKLLGICAERFAASTQRIPDVVTLPETREADISDVVQPDSQPTRAAQVSSFLNDKWGSTSEEKLNGNAPEKTEEIVRHGLPLLIGIISPDAKAVRDDALPDVTLLYETDAGRTGLSICTSPNMTSLAAQLKRLKSQLSLSRLNRLGIVRDNRVPISPNAKVARQHLEELEKNPKVFFVRPVPEVLAALDALRALLTDTKSGDLSCQGEAITTPTLEGWLLKSMPASLRDLVDEVLGKPLTPDEARTADSHDLEILNTLLSERPIVTLDDAVHALRKNPDAVNALVQRYSEQIGLVGGTPQALFRRINTQDKKD